MGSAHPSIVPYQAFEDSTGRWFIVAAANDRLWESMCRALGREDLTRNPKYSSNPARVANREELVGKLQKLFKQRPREYWMELLDRAGVPTAPVYRLSEVFRDPHIKGSGLEVDIQHPRLGKVKQLAEPVLINGVRPIARTPPPLLGQHTEEVLKELNYSDEEIEAMRKEGVIL